MLPLVKTNPEFGLLHDGKGYDNLANNILNGNGYSRKIRPPFEADMKRTPMYPFFLSIIYRFAGAKNYNAVYYCQIILGALACVVTYLVGRLLFKEDIAFIAALLLSIDLMAITYTFTIMTETIFLFLWLLSCYFLIKFLLAKKETISNPAAAGFFLGIATLCRPVTYYFPVMVFGLTIIWWIRKIRSTQSCIKGFCFFVTTFLLVVFPWIWRNYQTFQKPSLTDISTEVFLLNHAASVEVFLTGDSHDEVKNRYRAKLLNQEYPSKKEELEACRKYALEVIQSHPLVYVKSQLYGCFKMLFIGHHAYFFSNFLDRRWIAPGISTKEGGVLEKLQKFYNSNHWAPVLIFFMESIYTLITGLLVFIALFLLYKERNISTLLLLFTLFFYFVPISSGGVGTSNRVILPLKPYILMAATYCMLFLWRRYLGSKNEIASLKEAV